MTNEVEVHSWIFPDGSHGLEWIGENFRFLISINDADPSLSRWTVILGQNEMSGELSQEMIKALQTKQTESPTLPPFFGYGLKLNITDALYDPKMSVDCPICHQPLSHPVTTLSYTRPNDKLYYYCRMHSACFSSEAMDQVYNMLIGVQKYTPYENSDSG